MTDILGDETTRDMDFKWPADHCITPAKDIKIQGITRESCKSPGAAKEAPMHIMGNTPSEAAKADVSVSRRAC